MLKIVRTIQLPVTIFNEDAIKVGELYTVTNRIDDSYVVAGLSKFTDDTLFFDNGMEITATDIEQGEYQLSPVETYLDRWVAIYYGKEDSLSSSFFVAYDKEDAMEVAKELSRSNPLLGGAQPIMLLSLSAFMDNFGYMPHGSAQVLSLESVKGVRLNVSK